MCSCRQCPRSDLAMVFSSALVLGSRSWGQPVVTPLAPDYGLDDVHAGLAGDVPDHVLQLHVHLGQRLLHVLHVLGSILHQHGPLPQVAAQAA